MVVASRGAYGKAWRQNRKKLGQCMHCTSDALPGYTFCAYHLCAMAKRSEHFRMKNKDQIFLALGGKCSQCGVNDWRILQVDHVNGDGAMDKKRHNAKDSPWHYTEYTDWIVEHPSHYQLLCPNCHALKTIDERRKHGAEC